MVSVGPHDPNGMSGQGFGIDAAAVLDSITDAVMVFDRDWRFAFVNERAKALLGRAEDLLGKGVWQEFPAPPAGEFETACRVAMAERGTLRCDEFFPSVGLWLQSTIYPCSLGITVYCHDVTIQKRQQLAEFEASYASAPAGLAIRSAEARKIAVRQREELERLVAERTADRDRLWQLSADLMIVLGSDGVATAVNPAWTTMLGWTERELIGRSLFDIIHPGDHQATVDATARMSQGVTMRDFENRIRHHDGSYHWITWIAAPGDGLIHAVGRDVTAEKAKTAALELSVARLRSVFETSYQYQGLMTTDGILLEANATSLEGIAARLEDVVGKPFWQTPWFTGTPGMPEQVEAAIPLVAAGQTVRREIVVDLPTGRRAFDFSMRPVLNDAGDVIAIVPEASELTARREAEEQLRQAQKVEAIGQLTSGLAHDFNNLLSGITGSLDLLGRRLAQGRLAELDRYLVAAQDAASRAAALTHRLLAFSRRQALDPVATNVNQLVAGMEELIRRTVGPQIVVEVVAAADIWSVVIDQNQLESSLLNLCINARDAMPDGGRLVIETGNCRFDAAAARERDLLPGAYVALAVTDTGVGMASDIIAHAFEPFFTTKPFGQGTGLGLAMILRFARQFGGQARIESEPGRGTTACLYLPRQSSEVGSAEPDDEPLELPHGRQGETVLVVDDEPTIRMLIIDVLEDLGYTAIDAEDGAAGLRILQAEGRVDLLITDLGLPGGMNGRQLAEAGKLARPDLKVLFITGYGEAATIDAGRPAGAHLLSKPFAIDALAARIKEIITGG
jgi:PAS domain S-box-containing protein